jgi:hypothetical protein
MADPVRPVAAVPWRDRRFVPLPTADVHGRRTDLALAAPYAPLERLARWLSPAFYVDLGRPCNSACLYCAVPPHEDARGFLPLDELGPIVAAGAAAGCDKAILIGGEPTIFPQLDEVLAGLAAVGLRDHVVMTNGLQLADERRIDALAAGGVATFHLSIDTFDGPTYDRLSRSNGRLPRQLQALGHLLARPHLNLYLYTALTAINAAGLPQLLQGVAAAADRAGVPPPPVVIASAKPLGDALRHADALLQPPAQSAALVADAVTLGDRLGVAVGYRNLQACLLPGLVARNVDYYLDDYSLELASGRRLMYRHASEHWYKPPACAGCGHFEQCTGLYRGLTARFGEAAYRPIGPQGLLASS